LPILIKSGYALLLSLCVALGMAMILRVMPRRSFDSALQSLFDSQRQQRQAEARATSAQRQLSLAIEAFSDVVLLLDGDDRIILANDAWRTLNTTIPHATVPGTRFEDFLRAAVAAGLFPDAAGHEENWTT
jgi:PAS domain-containing protein